MNNAGLGKPANGEAMHSLPVQPRALAPSRKRSIPTQCLRLPKTRKRIDVGRYAVVRVVSADHRTEPTSLLPYRLVQTAAQFESDLPNLAPQSRAHRATLQKEFPIPRASAAVRQPEEV